VNGFREWRLTTEISDKELMSLENEMQTDSNLCVELMRRMRKSEITIATSCPKIKKDGKLILHVTRGPSAGLN